MRSTDRPRSRRQRLARYGLVLFLGLGLAAHYFLVPLETRVCFDIPPHLAHERGSIAREEVASVRATVFDDAGEDVARIHLVIPGGQVGPLTSAALVRARRGSYAVEVVVRAADGREAKRLARLELGGDDLVRVEIE